MVLPGVKTRRSEHTERSALWPDNVYPQRYSTGSARSSTVSGATGLQDRRNPGAHAYELTSICAPGTPCPSKYTKTLSGQEVFASKMQYKAGDIHCCGLEL